MILEAIYSGDFYPSETVVPKSEKYRNALKACEKIMDRLAEKLSKEDYDLVEELQDQASIAQSEENECHFKVGFEPFPQKRTQNRRKKLNKNTEIG